MVGYEYAHDIQNVHPCTCSVHTVRILLASFPGLPRGLVHTVRACVAIFKIAHVFASIGVILKCGRVMKRHEILDCMDFVAYGSIK